MALSAVSPDTAGAPEPEDLLDEPWEMCKAFRSTTSSKRERVRSWSSGVTCVRPLFNSIHSIHFLLTLHLMGTCTSCGGDREIPEDTMVLLNMTSSM